MNDPFAAEWEDEGGQEAGGNPGSFLSLLPVIFWERKLWVIIPAIIGIVAAIASVFLIPPVYRANAVMLVASPQLPDEILALDGDQLIDRRMARIKQQVTSRPNLISMIERHGLYADERSSSSLSEIVEDMRESIELVPNRSGNRRDDDTISFELAFEYSEPVPAQTVAQDLMERVLALESTGNVEQVTNTVEFLEEQSFGIQTRMAELKGRIAQLTAANGGVLGSSGGFIGNSTAGYDVQIAGLQRENQQLNTQRALALSSNERDPIVLGAEQQLAGARAVYAEDHPDVVFAKQRLAEAKELAKTNTTRQPIEQIDEQIGFNNQQIAALRRARSSEEAMMQRRADAQARAPLVIRQLGDLETQLAALNQQYEQVQDQLLKAEAGVRAEDEQMSERLVVVEPPVVPTEAVWPDRLLLLAGGIIGGLGLGVVLALGLELLLQPIRHPGALSSLTGKPPLGVIPIIEDREGRTKKRRLFGWPFRRQAQDV